MDLGMDFEKGNTHEFGSGSPTSALVETLMCSQRSANPWNVFLQRKLNEANHGLLS